MSHISIIKIKLKNVNLELLKQVVEQLCKEHWGQMVNHIEDFAGQKTKVDLAFKCSAFPRGIAFEVERGEVSIKGDFYRYHEFQRQIENQLTQTYTVQAFNVSLRQQGFQTQTQKVGEKVLIRAYQW